MGLVTFESYPIVDNQPFPEIGLEIGWVQAISSLTKSEILEMLELSWYGDTPSNLHPVFDTILKRDLICLSIDRWGDQWLKFQSNSSCDIYVPLPSPTRSDLDHRPQMKIRGMREFLKYLCGMVVGNFHGWGVPEMNELEIVNSYGQSSIHWGVTGKWEGALTIYRTGSGNVIVNSVDNECGVWNHDLAYHETETPFVDLEMSFDELILRYESYLNIESEPKDCWDKMDQDFWMFLY